MGWAIRNKIAISGAGTSTLAVVAGDLIIVCPGGVTAAAASDNVNGTYSFIGPFTTDRPSQVGISYKIASTTATLTIDPHGTCDSWGAASWSHDGGTIPGTANTSGSAISSANINLTTSVANTLIVAVSDASGSNVPGTGFTVISQILNADRITSEYETDMTNSAGSNTVSFSQGTARGMLAAAFDPPTAAGLVRKSTIVRQAVNRASTY